MGWFNTLLDVASVSLEISHLGKLEELHQQGESAAKIQAILHELRDRIFNYKQAAENILESKEENLKISTGAMRILELRLVNSGITPDIFPDLHDKEYVASTIKFIHSSVEDLFEHLSPLEIAEIKEMAEAAVRIPPYSYYVKNYSNLQIYKNAKENYQKYSGISSIGIRTLIGCVSMIGVCLSLFLCTSIAIFLNIFPLIGTAIGFIISFTILVLTGILTMRAKESKDKVNRISKKINAKYLMFIDDEIDGNYGKAKKFLEESISKVHQFFGDSPLLPI